MREVTRSEFAARPRPALTLFSAAMAASLGACSYLPEMPSMPTLGSFKAYRIDIQQGNHLSAEMVSQLKEGMTREQVRFVLGTPLVTDVFHADRWDYIFYRELAGGKTERRHLSVFFEDNKLKRFTGENLPTAESPASGAKPAAGQATAQSAEKK
jgi:outer membrane protein assembly factor BamE